MLQIDDLTGDELDQVERYVGEPIFGLLKAGEVRAQKAEYEVRRDAKRTGLDGEALAAAVEEAREQAMLAVMPARLFTALAGVERQREDPTFGPDQWGTLKPLKTSPFGSSPDGLTPPDGSEPGRTARSPATTGGPSERSGA